MIRFYQCGDDLVIRWMKEWWVTREIDTQHIDLFQPLRMPAHAPLPATSTGQVSNKGDIGPPFPFEPEKIFKLEDVLAAILKRELAFSDPTTKRWWELAPPDVQILTGIQGLQRMRIHCRLKSCREIKNKAPKNA